MSDHFLSRAASGQCRLVIQRSGDQLASVVTIARDSASRKQGLLGRDSIGLDEAMVIAPCQGIHTFKMRFAIDVVAVDRRGRVVTIRSSVPRRRIVLAWSAFAFIELRAGALARVDIREHDYILVDTIIRI